MARRGYNNEYDDNRQKEIQNKIQVDEGAAALERKNILAGDESIWASLLKSKKKIMLAANDTEFLTKIDMMYPNKNYSQMIKNAANTYALEDAHGEALKNIEPELKKSLIKTQLKYEVLNSLSAGMDSPAKEIWEAFFGAIAEATKANDELKAELKMQAAYDKADDTGFGKDLSLFINENTTEEQQREAGMSQEDINEVNKESEKAKEDSIDTELDPNYKSDDEDKEDSDSELVGDEEESNDSDSTETDLDSGSDDLDDDVIIPEVVDDSEDESTDSNQLPDLKDEDKKKVSSIIKAISKAANRAIESRTIGTDESPLVTTFENGIEKYGTEYETKYLPYANEKLKNRDDFDEISDDLTSDLKKAEEKIKEKEDESKSSDKESMNFSKINKILSKKVQAFTIIRRHNLFSKISEFIKDRFPNNFSKVDGNKIYLNDGRYLKTKITDVDKFTITSFSKDNCVQSKLELPLKVHKYKWFCSINENIMNGEKSND